MITAMQSAKLTACAKLGQAVQLINECRSLICLSVDQSRLLGAAVANVGDVVEACAPSNDGPPERTP